MDCFRALTRTQETAVHLGLLALQTAAATFLFWNVFPLFRQMMAALGRVQELAPATEVAIIAGALVLHCAYWTRCRWIAVRPPFHSVFFGHLVQLLAGPASSSAAPCSL